MIFFLIHVYVYGRMTVAAGFFILFTREMDANFLWVSFRAGTRNEIYKSAGAAKKIVFRTVPRKLKNSTVTANT